MSKYPWQDQQDKRKEERKIRKAVKKAKAKPIDAALWKAFSIYIRVRDADENGVCKCFTCGRLTIWNKNTDCGHGIGRQHKATKYNEKNNHAQCKKCNGFEGGMREKYKEEMNKRYGGYTWELMEIAARKSVKLGVNEIDTLTKQYENMANIIIKNKGLKISN